MPGDCLCLILGQSQTFHIVLAVEHTATSERLGAVKMFVLRADTRRVIDVVYMSHHRLTCVQQPVSEV